MKATEQYFPVVLFILLYIAWVSGFLEGGEGEERDGDRWF